MNTNTQPTPGTQALCFARDRFLASVGHCLRKGERPTEVTWPDGVRQDVFYSEDEDGEPFAFLDDFLPKGWTAEIDGETYGQLFGVRFYLNEDR
jgi:hypothetical protein